MATAEDDVNDLGCMGEHFDYVQGVLLGAKSLSGCLC